MLKTTIKLQSIIDIITNSSTEVFVTATNSTVNAVKSLLASLTGISENKIQSRFKIYLSEDNECDYNDMDYCNTNVIIEAKNEKDEVYVKLINDLIYSFNYDAAYNG
ncbi:MAG: hypothetical protein RSE41_04165 [Clostridia bacterium]